MYIYNHWFFKNLSMFRVIFFNFRLQITKGHLDNTVTLYWILPRSHWICNGYLKKEFCFRCRFLIYYTVHVYPLSTHIPSLALSVPQYLNRLCVSVCVCGFQAWDSACIIYVSSPLFILWNIKKIYRNSDCSQTRMHWIDSFWTM